MSTEPKFKISDVVKYDHGPTAICRVTRVYPNHGGKNSHYYYGRNIYGGHVSFYENVYDRHTPILVFNLDEWFFKLVLEELTKARKKFPGNTHQLAALSEEHGELSNALLENDYGNGDCTHVLEEAAQVAAMAFRVALEGDGSFKYNFPLEEVLTIDA